MPFPTTLIPHRAPLPPPKHNSAIGYATTALIKQNANAQGIAVIGANTRQVSEVQSICSATVHMFACFAY